jgi:hypothetical protein
MSDDIKTAIGKTVETFTKEDKLGRVISLRKPGTLAQYRFVEMLGKSADSETYMNMVMPLRYVVGIDDDLAIPCGTKRELEALIQRLGEEGIAAVMEAVTEHFAGADPAKDKDEIKKS